MSRSHKDFVAMIELGEGDHEYKFLVDGQWITDSGAPTVENNSGKVEKFLEDSLDSISSSSPWVKIQIMVGKVCLRCKGKLSHQ